jgi:hypothetical protein
MLGRMGNGVLAAFGGRHRAAWYAGFAVYAAGVALFSGPGLDRWWGVWAAGGYGLASVVAAVTSGRASGREWGGGVAVAVSLAGALAAPTLWLMTREPTPPDVAVVARSGVLLLHHGTPYLPLASLSAGGWLAYNPYLPVMALFGLPGAAGLPGKTWPWLIAVTFLLLYATFVVTLAPRAGGRRRDALGHVPSPLSRLPITPAPRAGGRRRDALGHAPSRLSRLPGTPALWVGGRRRDALGQAAFWLACPVMALPLTMGITDPPVIALTCLALALLARGFGLARGLGQPKGAGSNGAGSKGRVRSRDMTAAALVLGVACAMKYTAWPALAIIAVLVAARCGARSAVRFTVIALAAAAALVAALAPAALRHPASILQNTVAYPLGLTSAKSPAASPLPGHLLATLGSGGHLAALVLLAAAGLAIVASLVLSPPATAAAAARRIAIGLSALFLLSPATRFGYFIYPIALYAWAALADREGAGAERRAAAGQRSPDVVEAGVAEAGATEAGVF